ncbi:uncharacterized protein LOC126843445 [Adelges cooleyi]|uniref:uncharacterized protein LOC126843445 n=1 Tax=Adelges cooleyi TaxID=133065 RepID=UPI002180989A|nr:uncharacterized protein LOC126843445 [Adelges cooleyi]
MSNYPMTASKTPCHKGTMYLEFSNLLKEISHYMPEFKASIKDLQEPSQAFVTQFYTDVFNEFFCDVMNLTEIPFDSNLTYREMYTETVPIVNTCAALRLMFSKLGIDDFGVNDICDPNPKRTYRLIQTMISFIKYSDEKINQISDNMKAIRTMKIKKSHLKDQKEYLIKSINQKKLLFQQLDGEMVTIKGELQTGKSELEQLLQHKARTLKEMDAVKQKQETTEKQVKILADQKHCLTKEIRKYRENIVEQPDLLKADLEQLKRTKMEIEEKKKCVLAQVSSIKQTLILMKTELAAQQNRHRLLTDHTEQIQIIANMENEVDSMMQNIDEYLTSNEKLRERIEKAERDHIADCQKLSIQNDRIENEYKKVMDKFDILQNERDEKLMKSKQIEDVKMLINKELSNLKSLEQQLKDNVAEIVEDYLKVKNSLTQRQTLYQESVLKKIEELKISDE